MGTSFNPHKEAEARLRLAVEDIHAALNEVKVVEDRAFFHDLSQLSFSVEVQHRVWKERYKKQLK
jgi:hypothetical protein